MKIIYFSQSGNTEKMANLILQGIESEGKKAELLEVSSVSIDDVKDDEILILGCSAYGSEEFRANVAKGLVFMVEHDGPYLVHCTEGKDRTGFISALLEALMGATKDEIVADYMESYINYYGVEPGTEKYNLIAQDVLDMLKVITGNSDLEKADLEAGARNYLILGGMKPAQIEQLMNKLSKPISSSENSEFAAFFLAMIDEYVASA